VIVENFPKVKCAIGEQEIAYTYVSTLLSRIKFSDLSNWICLLSGIAESPSKLKLGSSNQYRAVKNYAPNSKFIVSAISCALNDSVNFM